MKIGKFKPKGDEFLAYRQTKGDPPAKIGKVEAAEGDIVIVEEVAVEGTYTTKDHLKTKKPTKETSFKATEIRTAHEFKKACDAVDECAADILDGI